ncbi:MAG: hypothetical protein AAF492_29200 [Verrucomicrobiota bacterium]
MTISRTHLLNLLLIVVLVVAVRIFFFGDKEKEKILKQLDVLQELVTKTGPEGGLTFVKKTTKLMTVFTDEAKVNFGPPLHQSAGREEIVAIYKMIKTGADTISIKTSEKEIEVAPDKKNARMTLTVKAELRQGIDTAHETRNFEIFWAKPEKLWKIEEVKLLDTIRRPQSI